TAVRVRVGALCPGDLLPAGRSEGPRVLYRAQGIPERRRATPGRAGQSHLLLRHAPEPLRRHRREPRELRPRPDPQWLHPPRPREAVRPRPRPRPGPQSAAPALLRRGRDRPPPP